MAKYAYWIKACKKGHTTEEDMEKREKKQLVLWCIAFLAFCGVGIALFFALKDKMTLEGIIHATPANQLLAVAFIVLLFAIKSILFFIYGGLLYAVCGVIFPFPMAILVNLIGSVVMISIPYAIGKKAGAKALGWLTEKCPKTAVLQRLPHKNQLFSCFILRIIGKLPGDLVSVYLGASGIGYGNYALGSLLGFLPSLIAFSVMGGSIENPTSPAFLIALGVEIALIILAVVWQIIKSKKRKKTNTDKEEQ